jgi:hypothetical protein
VVNTCSSSLPKLVIFDLFGTHSIWRMHHPFRQLPKWARENGRQQPKTIDARKLKTINADIPELSAALDISAPRLLIDQIKKSIQEELSSLLLICIVV